MKSLEVRAGQVDEQPIKGSWSGLTTEVGGPRRALYVSY